MIEHLRICLEGIVPSAIATVGADGTPNSTYVSQVHFVDPWHVALSFQFFNKTHKNVLHCPMAQALVIHPVTAQKHRLDLRYLRTETSGALFEAMKAKLSGIASHAGMSGVFELVGADVYRVLSTEQVGPPAPLSPGPEPIEPGKLRCIIKRLDRCSELSVFLSEMLEGLAALLGGERVALFLLDESGQKLFAVASAGYEVSGVGAEIAVGCGVVGVAARYRTPIRIAHATAEYSYARAVRDSIEKAGMRAHLETAIPLPGLPGARSQLAIPLGRGERLLGVLFAESEQDARFSFMQEDALCVLAPYLISRIHELSALQDTPPGRTSSPANAPPGPPVQVRHFAADDSVFLGEDYLIKGVAGAIFWWLLRASQQGREEFSNRELRLDPSLKLPEQSDNLEARLVLLQRRLEDRRAFARIQRTARGRFRLLLERAFELHESSG